jgi:molybdenum cofactor cytidylyltransferase
VSGGVLIAILAAGRSSRFGSDKLAADFRGLPLGEHVHRLARSTGHPLVWITGNAGRWTPPGCDVVQNAHANKGMGTSVALAAQTARAKGADALMILLADMPLIKPATLQIMLDDGAPICCRYPDGNPGPPALLPKSQFAELIRLNGDTGARHLLRAVPDMAFIETDADEMTDIDTPTDIWSG